jgi:hypothetical protein
MRYIKFGSLLITLTLVWFLLDARLVEAAWQRMGESNTVFNVESICRNGFTVWNAELYGDDIDSSEFEPTNAVIKVYQFADIVPDFDELSEPTFVRFPANIVSRIVASGTVTMRYNAVSLDIPEFNTISTFYGKATIQWSNSFDFENYPFLYFLEESFDGFVRRIAPMIQSVPDCAISDGRLNTYDGASSAVIYCINDDIHVYGVAKDSKGFLSFIVTQDEIETLGVPTENTLIASGPSGYDPLIRLYRLSSGEFQINAPDLSGEADKEYTFIWKDC